MAQGKKLCTDEHICAKCKKPTLCHTYTWACPWRNEDEDDMCDPCMEKFAEEYEQWYFNAGLRDA